MDNEMNIETKLENEKEVIGIMMNNREYRQIMR